MGVRLLAEIDDPTYSLQEGRIYRTWRCKECKQVNNKKWLGPFHVVKCQRVSCGKITSLEEAEIIQGLSEALESQKDS